MHGTHSSSAAGARVGLEQIRVLADLRDAARQTDAVAAERGARRGRLGAAGLEERVGQAVAAAAAGLDDALELLGTRVDAVRRPALLDADAARVLRGDVRHRQSGPERPDAGVIARAGGLGRLPWWDYTPRIAASATPTRNRFIAEECFTFRATRWQRSHVCKREVADRCRRQTDDIGLRSDGDGPHQAVEIEVNAPSAQSITAAAAPVFRY